MAFVSVTDAIPVHIVDELLLPYLACLQNLSLWTSLSFLAFLVRLLLLTLFMNSLFSLYALDSNVILDSDRLFSKTHKKSAYYYLHCPKYALLSHSRGLVHADPSVLFIWLTSIG